VFSEDLNTLNRFWIQNPESTMVDTLKFATKNCFLSNPVTQKELDEILEEYDKFNNRRIKKFDKRFFEKGEAPTGSNPFMTDFD
jgi:hypothetical protein